MQFTVTQKIQYTLSNNGISAFLSITSNAGDPTVGVESFLFRGDNITKDTIVNALRQLAHIIEDDNTWK